MFNFTYAPGTTLQQMLGFEIAGRVWDAYLNDNVTINLHVSMVSSSSLPTNVIGGALPAMRANAVYAGFYNHLASDRKSLDDAIAFGNLNGTDNAWFDQFVDNVNHGTTASAQTINLTRANAKALGYSFTDLSALDGYIMLSDLAGTSASWSYDYTRSAAAGSKTLDFLSTVVHEIGHILGFVSGIDRPGWVHNSFTTQSIVNNPTAFYQFQSSIADRVKMTMPLDLFRYSSFSRSKNAIRDMSYGSGNGNKYFSIDKGRTALGHFATGADKSLGGDGEQASHWQSKGLMAPTLAVGKRSSISTLDLRALDVIGWDVNTAPTINLSSLLSQSINALVMRSGQTATWITNNLTASLVSLVANRSTDVDTMLTNSQIYNWGNEPGDDYWQKIFSLMSLQGMFSSLDEVGSTGGIQPREITGQVDLQALLASPDQQPTILSRSTSSTFIADAEPEFSIASLSMPSLILPGQGLDAAKVWTIGEKKPLIPTLEAQPIPTTTQKFSWLDSEIDV